MPPLSDWQYRIMPSPDGLTIEHGPGIGCHEVISAQGERLGWLIGFPIDLEARRVIDGPLQIEASEGLAPDALAHLIFERISGQFLWVTEFGSTRCIYPDVTAQVPCVYDPVQKCAALCVPAMWSLEQSQERFDRELYDHMRVDAEGWLPAGLTSHHGAHRLLPNHYLDLDTWESVRFRGSADLFAPTSLDDACEIVSGLVAAQVEALHQGGRGVALSLTAGRDCRMVAAAAAHLRDDVTFVTLTDPSALNMDTQMARRIAAELGLKHLELPAQYADDAEREAYIARGGHCISGANSRLFISMAPLRENHVFVGGLGGEHARGYMWNDRDGDDWPTAESLLRRFSFKPHPRVIDRMQAWLEDIDAQTPQQVYEMAYMELREACWASAQFPCDPTLIRHQPMRSVPTIRAMLGLSDADKKGARLAQAMIDKGWPELGAFPINSLGKTKDTLAKVRRVLRDPEALIRKLRRLRS